VNQAPGWVVAPADGWVAPKGWTPDGRLLAGPGRRFLGYVYDWLVFSLPVTIVSLIVFAVLAVKFLSSVDEAGEPHLGGGFVVAILVIYVAVTLVSLGTLAIQAELVYRRSATPGMRWAGLRVVDAKTGGAVSRGKAWGRTAFAAFISAQIYGIGYFWAFWDDRNRTLHDLVAGTVVIDERSGARPSA
jgi:uncharacterized RDD family membrane protein YckC